MYTLKITDENTVITTVKESIVERSNAVDKIQIITNKMYRDQIDMTDVTVYMKYTLPVTKTIKMIKLIAHDINYETNYIQYIIPADARITAEPGDIEVTFTFYKLVKNLDDSITSYVRKTQSGIISITPLVPFDKYVPDEMLDGLDKQILSLMARQKDIEALNEAIYNGLVKELDIRYDDENDKITLTNREGDTGKGIKIDDLSSIIAEGMLGKDPDGEQDGVVNLDNVVQLDNLLK